MLSTWKEIAEYLGKGVRTVQRWNNEAGLPVHRDGQTVRAFRAEIDAWICGRSWRAEQEDDIDIAQICDSANRLHAAVNRLYETAEQLLQPHRSGEQGQAATAV